MSVIVVATIIPLDGQYEAVAQALAQAVPEVQAEDGCEFYALNAGHDRLVMIEKWATAGALEVHNSAAALQRLGAAIQGKIAGAPDIQVLQARPAGTAEKGAL